MKLLNLGCGGKTSARDGVINIDWSISLRLKQHGWSRRLIPLLLRGDRLKRFNALPDNILVHDLARGIPFATDSVDAVYHSHVLEHLDRSTAPGFLREVHRVLKPGGVHRIVVPDFEWLCRRYVVHLDACDAVGAEAIGHDAYVSDVLEQSVRREAHGTSLQGPLRRRIENALLGDARQRGETHQWMYDRVNLSALLTELGYREVRRRDYATSAIPDWNAYGLDLDDSGHEYRPDSLYMEALK